MLWQLPWTPPKVPVGPSEEEIARKAAAKERAGQRLRDMAAAKRAAKVAELEGQLQGLEAAKEELELLREAQQVEDTSDEAEVSGPCDGYLIFAGLRCGVWGVGLRG